MKSLSLLLCATLLAVAAPVPTARAEVNVSIDFFFDNLSPHGDWIYADDYGYVFQPAMASQSDWAPYSDGYWAYTDAGWTWISEEPFGWATYHYGRWVRMQGSWVWVPGYEWAPAWVSWRQTDDYIGWAPLPPEARWTASIGFNQWSDAYYDVGPAYYNFVPFNLFARRSSLRPVIVDRSRNITYVNRSVNVTNITYRQNVVNNIFVGGPDPDRFDRGDNRIRRLRLSRDDDRFRQDWIDRRDGRDRDFRSLSRIEDDRLLVAAPSIRRDDAPALPSRVSRRIERPEIDRGWRGAGDSKAIEQLRERRQAEFAKAKPANLPAKGLEIATSKAPPPAVGRLLSVQERQRNTQRPNPREVDEEVRKGLPPGAASKLGKADQPPAAKGEEREGRTMTRPDVDRTPRDDARDERDRGPGSRMPPGADRDERRPGPGADRNEDRRPEGTMRPERDSNDRRPGVKPDEAPRPRLAPGVVPDETPRRRGGASDEPDTKKSKVQDSPPSPKTDSERKAPAPKAKPEMPRVKPEATRPVPMPEPKATPKTRPMPKSEAPKAKTVPMPKPQRPSVESRDTRVKAPEVKAAKPQARPSIPQAKSAPKPEVRKSAPQPRPQVKQAAPKPATRPQAKPERKKKGDD